MPVTPLTTEGRAVVQRMREFQQTEGNIVCMRKLIYEDSATVIALIHDLDALGGVDESIMQGMYQAAATCGNAGEGSGNTQLWPLMLDRADKLIAGIDVLEAAPDATPKSKREADQ